MVFQNEIIEWYKKNKRDLPWRHTNDAYTIWLSEIILQQTRVDQGLPYFNRFLANYPTVGDFAAATEQQILKLWQGLGYYSRGRNMLFTAKTVMEMYNGIFPERYDELIKLKGIGDYTAAAIASFSSNEAKAVVDGNVSRVLARYFGVEKAINSSEGKKEISSLAQALIEDQPASVYNQAIMEFGALHCKPKQPLCNVCPLQQSCYAFAHKKVAILPLKEKKIKVKERRFNYFLCLDGEKILMRHRGRGDVWQHLYDLPLIETELKEGSEENSLQKQVSDLFGKEASYRLLDQIKHQLTHQIIYVQFFALDNYIVNFNKQAEIKWVSEEELKTLPMPKPISVFLKKYVE
ncbi:A/G-specific adenine glycosylase [Pedobacter sp.]|uniref:A/G-specific adenine glycosylase n=1 Tax=Pedobacter sp. TaxID=1411316 RepID=UPI00396C9F5A